MQKIVKNSIETTVLRRNWNSPCRLCSTIEDHLFPRPPDVNRIRLIGRVSSDMSILPDSFHAFRMTTTEKKAFFGDTPICKTHIIRAKKGLTLPIIPHLEEGDYVLVDGILAAGKKIVDPTETIYKPLVLAQLIIPFEDTHRSNDPDALCKESTNEVELFGRVISDLEDGGYLSFHLRANKTLPVDVGPHIVYKHIHKIRVENPKLMELVRKNVATSDYVAIRGSIEYMKQDISGRAITRAGILAEAIEKMNGPGELKDIITGRYKFGRKFNQHYLVPEAANS